MTEIDVKKGLQLLGGNASIYLRLLGNFSTNALFAEFVEAVRTGDTDTAAQRAHAVKGVAANLCLPELYSLIASLEGDLKMGISLLPDDPRFIEVQAIQTRTLAAIRTLQDNPGMLESYK